MAERPRALAVNPPLIALLSNGGLPLAPELALLVSEAGTTPLGWRERQKPSRYIR